ncbi:hypothetical protein PROFUN_09151 [Planoprotostelium fungivorum]|uniref:Uncharacterized protein n=1 Tax=Planoprotostelium fungivorum TaxID=1890364 RepID=A0A2P6MVJ7_9EUKA|nr:hypothetical protein PROFUN_09151 [Planoprotostelium fungivorum]
MSTIPEQNLPPPAPAQKPATRRPTTRNILYIIVMNVIGATILDAGINLGIAAAMYTNAYPVRVWEFPNTMAGDAAVTVFIQGILTWVISGMLTSRDLRLAAFGISPIRAPRSIREGPRIVQWFFGGNLDILERRIGHSERLRRLVSSIVHGVIYSIAIFFIAWPIGVGILAATAGPGGFIAGWPTAAYFKAAFGGGMGFWQTPIIVVIAMMRKGWPERDEYEARKIADKIKHKQGQQTVVNAPVASDRLPPVSV